MKAKIKENLGESRYVVDVIADNPLLTAEISALKARRDESIGRINTLTGDASAAEDAFRAALANQNSVIDQYRVAVDSFTLSDALASAQAGCVAERFRCQDDCAYQHDHAPSCYDACDVAYTACMVQAPARAAEAELAHKQGVRERWAERIASAQQTTQERLTAYQRTGIPLALEKARLLACEQQLTEFEAIRARQNLFTVFAAQYDDTLEPDAQVEVAQTPEGRHAVTAITSVTNCWVDSRTLPARYLTVDAALVTGRETWAPTWRTGVVKALNDDGTLKVQFDTAVLTGSLGTLVSRREINCTPPQAYFDDTWKTIETDIAAKIAALKTAQEAFAAAQQGLTDCRAAFDGDALLAAKQANCQSIWTNWLIQCNLLADPSACQGQYEESLAACFANALSEVADEQALAYAICDDAHRGDIAATRAAVDAAVYALVQTRSMIAQPANPLILDLPIAHCVQSVYEVGDQVLIDFPVRAHSKEDPAAVWKSARVVGWADNPRRCGRLIEHGLFVCDLSDMHDAAASTPAYIYPGSAIDAWYSGAGWTVPESDPVQQMYFVGTIGGNAEAPTLIADVHPSLHGEGAENLRYLIGTNAGGGYEQAAQPGPYTGLARAIWQAWLGAGLKDAERAAHWSAGFSQAPGAMGLAYDSAAGVYWALNCGPGGLRAQRMKPGPLTEQLQAWLFGGDPADEPAKTLDRANVLSDLVPDIGRAVDVLIDAETMAPTYADGASPIQLGWVFDSTGTHAAIVTHRSITPSAGWEAFESALSHWALMFTDGEPSVVLTTGTFARFRPYWAYHKFWYGDGTFNLLRNAQTWPGSSDCAVSAPIICRYSDTDHLLITYYFAASIVSNYSHTGTTGDGIGTVCNSSSGGSTTTTATSAIIGGYGDSIPSPMLFGTVSTTSKNWTISGRSYNGDYNVSLNLSSYYDGVNTPMGRCSGPTWTQIMAQINGFTPDRIVEIRWLQGIGEGTKESATKSGAAGVQIMIYCPVYPDSVWFGMEEYSDSIATSGQRVTGSKMLVGAEVRALNYSQWNTYNNRVVVSDIGTAVYQTAFEQGPCSGTLTYGNAYVFCTAKPGAIFTSYSETTAGAQTCNMLLNVVGDTLATDADWSNWSAFDSNGQTPVERNLVAMRSTEGSVLYTPYPSADVTSNTSIPDAVFDQSTHSKALAWVGGA